MKFDQKKLKDILNLKKILGVFSSFLERGRRWIIFALFLSMFGYAGYIWYIYIYNPQWDERKRQEYIKSQDKGVTFIRGKFESAVSERRKRDEEFEKDMPELRDIFRIKK